MTTDQKGDLLLGIPMFNFERNFDPEKFRDFFAKYSLITGLPIVSFYIISIFKLQKFMQDKKPLNLKYFLVFWNFSLSIFSLAGAYRSIPAFIEMVNGPKGWRGTVCSNEFYKNKPEAVWTALFMLSKLPELLDTYILILRKRKLIFLHWYHHATVLAYGWFTFHLWYAGPGWYGTMNYSVHFIMYLYYGIMATKTVRLPKTISMMITTLQILQMIVGIGVQYFQYKFVDDEDCHASRWFIFGGSVMYGSYFVLFRVVHVSPAPKFAAKWVPRVKKTKFSHA